MAETARETGLEIPDRPRKRIGVSNGKTAKQKTSASRKPDDGASGKDDFDQSRHQGREGRSCSSALPHSTVVGDGDGRVGMGKGKSEVPVAVQKAMEEARRKMGEVSLKNGTLHHNCWPPWCVERNDAACS